MKQISIIVPVYNEQTNIPLFHDALVQVLNKIENYQFEIIFVDDGSEDQSFEEIKKIYQQHNQSGRDAPAGRLYIKYIRFSRNFGKEVATTAGLNHSTGEAVMMIDVDLQHPPTKIPEFIEKWEKGVQAVVGVRSDNNGEGVVKKLGSIIFYKLESLIGETKIMPRATDFRLLDRKVVDEFNRFTERNRMTRGLIDWLGFDQDYVYFEAPARLNGKASYSPLKLVKLALSSFVAHSLFPLKFAGYLGILIIAVSAPLGLFILVEKYILNDPWGMNFSGPAILAVILLFLVGIVLMCLGLIALYIGNIQREVINRPMYVIRETKK